MMRPSALPKLLVPLLFTQLALFPAEALRLAHKKPVPGLCGSYASVTKKPGNQYEIWTNSAPVEGSCPGVTCPGIVKYTAKKNITKAAYQGIVIPNSIINDVFDQSGQLHPLRMFSRPVVKNDGIYGYVAVAYVSPSYPSEDGQMTPAFLTSPDGVNWAYHGKFKGEPAGLSIFGSGMALRVSDASPRYTLYTDGFRGIPGTVALESDGNNIWKFARNEDNSIRDFRPPEYAKSNLIFHSLVEGKDKTLYMVATENWPPRAWVWMQSKDGGHSFTHLHRNFPIRETQKNVSLFVDGKKIRALANNGIYGVGNCYLKDVVDILPHQK
jgi:hypothetical protein